MKPTTSAVNLLIVQTGSHRRLTAVSRVRLGVEFWISVGEGSASERLYLSTAAPNGAKNA